MSSVFLSVLCLKYSRTPAPTQTAMPTRAKITAINVMVPPLGEADVAGPHGLIQGATAHPPNGGFIARRSLGTGDDLSTMSVKQRKWPLPQASRASRRVRNSPSQALPQE